MKTYRLADPARLDLRRIWHDVAEHSERRADRPLKRFHAKFQLIADQPLLQGSEDQAYGTPHRVTQVGDYVVFYAAIPSGARIVRVIHGAQDIGGTIPV